MYDNHTTGANHRACRGYSFEVKRRIYFVSAEHEGRRSTGYNGFELLVIQDTAAIFFIVYERAQRGSERQFIIAGFFHMPAQAEDARPLALLRSE